MASKTVKPFSVNLKTVASGSKSVMQRVFAAALLSEGKTIIENPFWCDDTISAKRIIEALGATVKIETNNILISSKFKAGNPLPKLSNSNSQTKRIINCGESGLSVRMFAPVTALFNEDVLLKGKGSLNKRPMKMFEKPFEKLGVKFSSNSGYLPVSVCGPIQGGVFKVDGSISSQILTGFLTALPKAKNNSVIYVDNLKSKPYVDLTINILKKFGIEIVNQNYKVFKIAGNQKFKAANIKIEGDWSNAAFFLVAGAISGKVEVSNLNINSKQADIKILEAIKNAGANIFIEKDKIIVKKQKLKSFTFDATDCPDLFPPLVVLAANCTGISTIKGVKRLLHKESNRAEALQTEFAKLNIKINIIDDVMYIKGGKITGGTIHSHNDHRIAMAGAIAAINAQSSVTIKQAESVNKSFPKFFNYIYR